MEADGESSEGEFRQEKRPKGRTRPRGEQPGPSEPVRCPLCQADVSALDTARRQQHTNRCLDEAERPPPAIPECPLCRKAFCSLQARRSHLKHCAAKMGLPPALLVQAVRRQEQQPSSSSSSSFPSCPPGHRLPSAPRVKKRKTFSSSVENLAKKPKMAPKVQSADEDLLVAMAMSRSLFEKEKAATKQLPRGRKPRAKPPTSPPPLLLQDPQKTRRATEERLAQLFSEVGELPSTPPLPPSHLLETERLRTAEARPGGSLWESSSLTGPCLPGSFMTPGLLLPPQPQLPETRSLAAPTFLPVPDLVGVQGTNRGPPETNLSQGRDNGGPGGCGKPRDLHKAQSLEEWERAQMEQDILELAEEVRGQEEEAMENYFSSLENREAPKRSHYHLVLLDVLASDFSRMFNNPSMSDIQFRVAGGEILHAHKFVLYARSPRLLEECKASRAEGCGIPTCQWLLSDFSLEAVSTFLGFLYTADPTVPPRVRSEVAILAARFGVKDLAALCQEDPAGTEVSKEGRARSREGHGEVLDELLEAWWLEVDGEARLEEAPAEAAAAAAAALPPPPPPPPPPENMSQEELEEIYEFSASQRLVGEEDQAEEEGGSRYDSWRSRRGKRMEVGGTSSRDQAEAPSGSKGSAPGSDAGLAASGGGQREPSRDQEAKEEEEEEAEEEMLFRAAMEASLEGPCSEGKGGGPMPSLRSPPAQGQPRVRAGDIALNPAPDFPRGWKPLPRARSPELGILPSAPQNPAPSAPPAAPALFPGTPRPTVAGCGFSSHSKAVPTRSPLHTPSGAVEALPPGGARDMVVLVLDSEEEEEGPEAEPAKVQEPQVDGSVSMGVLSLEPPLPGGAESPLWCCGSPLGLLTSGAEDPPSWDRGQSLVPDTPLPLERGSSSPWVGWSSRRSLGSLGSGAGPPHCSPSPPGRPLAEAPLPSPALRGPPGRWNPSGSRGSSSSSSFQEAELGVVVLEDSEEEEEDDEVSSLLASSGEKGGNLPLGPGSPAASWSSPGRPLQGANASGDELPGGGAGEDSGSSSSNADLFFLPPSQRGFKAAPPQKPSDGACLAREAFCMAGPQTPPMPSYSTMVTPELKKELKRFGVRALPKHQMVLKLKEIFQFTHEQEAAFPSLQAQRTPAANTHPKPAAGSGDARPGLGRWREGSKAAGGPLGSSPEKGPTSLAMSQGSSGPVPWQSSFPAMGQAQGAAEEPEQPPLGSQAPGHEPDPLEALRHYLRSTPGLCQRVLQYQPLELSVLQAELKGKGISLGLSRLLELLDALGVTFTTAESRREKRSPRKKKGTKKRTTRGRCS